MRLSLASSSLTVLLLALPATGLADKKADAKVHIDKATAAHKENRFDEAKKELEAAYAIDPQPQLLYALGQVNVKLGLCEEAIKQYELFLQTKPAPAPRDAANQAITTCRVALAQAKTQTQTQAQPNPIDSEPGKPLDPIGEDTERPPGGETGPAGPAQVDTSGPRPWYKDPIGLGLVGVGTASAITGVVLYLNARGKIDDAENAPTFGEAQEITDDAKSTRMMSIVFGGVGAALVAGGVVYFMKRDTGTEQRRVSVIPTTSGGLVTLSGQF